VALALLPASDAAAAQSPAQETAAASFRVAYIAEVKEEAVRNPDVHDVADPRYFKKYEPLKGRQWFRIYVQMWCPEGLEPDPEYENLYGDVSLVVPIPPSEVGLLTEGRPDDEAHSPAGHIIDASRREPYELSFVCYADRPGRWVDASGSGSPFFDVRKSSGKPATLRLGSLRFDLTDKRIKEGKDDKAQEVLRKVGNEPPSND
jgi:hypothetical protein